MASAPPATAATTTTASAAANTVPPTKTASFTSDPTVADFKVTVEEYLPKVPLLQGICVGAFVFDGSGRLLLVQRAPHDSYPLRWEVPGGGIDLEDESILHGLVRELREETGLEARRVSGLVGKGYTFLTRRPMCVCKYSFIVEVEDYEVNLDVHEHVAYVWATEDEVKARRCGDQDLVFTTNDQESVILDSFTTKRETSLA